MTNQPTAAIEDGAFTHSCGEPMNIGPVEEDHDGTFWQVHLCCQGWHVQLKDDGQGHVAVAWRSADDPTNTVHTA